VWLEADFPQLSVTKEFVQELLCLVTVEILMCLPERVELVTIHEKWFSSNQRYDQHLLK